MSDILIAQDRFNIQPTDSGNKNFTTSKLNGRTPKLALIWMRSQGDVAAVAFGACDGTNEICLSFSAEDNGNASDTKQTRETAGCIRCIDPTSTGGGSFHYEADFVTFIADGMTIDVTNPPPGSLNIANLAVMFFAGEDLEVEIGSFTADAAAASTNQLSFGSGITQWDAFIGIRTGDNQASIVNNHGFSFGLLSRNDGNSTGQCVHTGSDDNAGVSVVTYGSFDTEFLRVIDPVGSNAWSISRTASDDTSITFTKDENDFTDSHTFAYVAIGLAGLPVIADMIDTPVSTSLDWVVTSVGFRSQACIFQPSAIVVANRNTTVTTTPNGTGIAMSFVDTQGVNRLINGSFMEFIESDDVTVMRTATTTGLLITNVASDDTATKIGIANGTTGTVFTANGWVIKAADIIFADATARSFNYMAFGEADPTHLFRDEALRFASLPQWRM